MASKKGFTFRPREPGSDEESSHSNSSATSESDDELEVDNFDDTPNSFKGLDRDLPISEKQEKESVEGVAKTPFSEPWEDSDLIFVVEEEKFHVHRQIMSIHSPVFKAMFTSVGFKEATATEIGSLNPSGKRGTEDSILIDSKSKVLDIGLLKNTKGIEGVLF
ncbi:uncharacterized protein LOC114952312 [Acropora millepora]|uniref:uncharacterized protein LOC114952312 n=1 Tax=Acropora millepora TaxID=45264 RepID=UPI001CF4F71F|nr:uncharacterized protein LOC114952312 [Acropora millepora]